MNQPKRNNNQMEASLSSFDTLLEHRIRFAACVLLSQHDALNFSRLKKELKATDGNLGAQLRKLEDENYIDVQKEFVNRKPVSWYSLTQKGRDALKKHLHTLEKMIHQADVE